MTTEAYEGIVGEKFAWSRGWWEFKENSYSLQVKIALIADGEVSASCKTKQTQWLTSLETELKEELLIGQKNEIGIKFN